MHQAKKLALASAISMPVTDCGEEVVLEGVSCIYYPVWFQQGQEQVKALLNSGSEVNTMNPIFTWKRDLHI